ncbi:Smr/MutS family protein [Pseudenhygromyxa sp. WMMC2535]|nr:Smr/MutS family protein [Pseudenhygromyxa sp. WMMC2535]
MDGELDLHNFSPKEVAPLVREAIAVCRARGILDMRVVHGKGKGVLRRTVHALLDKHPGVESYRLGGQGEGGWGATMVRLRPPGADSG